jgi:hypothetical protein
MTALRWEQAPMNLTRRVALKVGLGTAVTALRSSALRADDIRHHLKEESSPMSHHLGALSQLRTVSSSSTTSTSSPDPNGFIYSLDRTNGDPPARSYAKSPPKEPDFPLTFARP